MKETIQVTDWGKEVEYCLTVYDKDKNIQVRSRHMLYWQWLECECDRINQDPEREAIITQRYNKKSKAKEKAIFANIPKGYIDLETQKGYAFRQRGEVKQ